MRFPTPPARIITPAITPRGWRTIRRTSRYATAAISSTVTTAKAVVWPEKLDQAAP